MRLADEAEHSLECNQYRQAERLTAASAGNPSEEIAEESCDLLERFYFDRRPQGGRLAGESA